MKPLLLAVIVHFMIYCYGQDGCENFSYGGRLGKLKVTEDMNVIPFKNSANLWGLKNKLNDSIIIQAQFKKICENYNDTAFIVALSNNNEGAINLKGDIIAPFLKGLYQFNVGDTAINYGGILSVPVCINGVYFMSNMFFVDASGDCIAYDYYPCPSGVKIANIKSLSPAQYYVQRAIEFKYVDINKSVDFFKKAFESDTNNAASYFSCSRMFIDEIGLNIVSHKNVIYEKYYPWIEYCIEKGIKFEKGPHYLLKLNKYKRDFYKSCVVNKNKTKEASMEVNRLKNLLKHEKYSTWW
jgi:hypothetical protein